MKDRYVALTALQTRRYKGVTKKIRKQYVYKIYHYLLNLTEVYDLLEHHTATIKTAEAGRAARRAGKRKELGPAEK